MSRTYFLLLELVHMEVLLLLVRTTWIFVFAVFLVHIIQDVIFVSLLESHVRTAPVFARLLGLACPSKLEHVMTGSAGSAV